METRVWIFQANPDRYRIFDSLQRETDEYWNLNQYSKDVQVGNRVLIWISGENAGIYAIGTVIDPPVLTADSETGIGYWIDKADGRLPKARVRVRYDQLLLDRPLSKTFLQADPDLWGLRIITFPRGTNFPVSDTEWNAIKRWLDVPEVT